MSVLEERYKALSEANKALMAVEDKLDEALKLLEPYAIPTVRGWLRSMKHRVFFIRAGYIQRLRIIREKLPK